MDLGAIPKWISLFLIQRMILGVWTWA